MTGGTYDVRGHTKNGRLQSAKKAAGVFFKFDRPGEPAGPHRQTTVWLLGPPGPPGSPGPGLPLDPYCFLYAFMLRICMKQSFMPELSSER
jgi:hypothetical protein